MSFWSDNLAAMVGQVTTFRPRVSPILVKTFINNRIRQAIEARPAWSDLMERRVISVPASYTTGTVSVTNGSAVVTGSGTSWPTNDVVNTTIPLGVPEIGYVRVTPASMTGITGDSVLYCDAVGTPEAIPVVEVGIADFVGRFAYYHNQSATITQSSLVGRQFRLSDSDPLFTIRAVHSATELELDMPWSTTASSGATYSIAKMYFSFGPELKEIIAGMDTVDGTTVRLHVSIQEMNSRDPQRSTSGGSGGVLELVDLGPSETGSMLYELWPPQATARQLWFLISKQWPELRSDTDRPPPFVNPTVFVNGAIADALRHKVDAQDVFHNPMLAREYEVKYQQGLVDAIQADDAKLMRNWSYDFERLAGGPSSEWLQSHDYSAMYWQM